MRSAIVFDDGKGVLGPLTEFRAAFDVRTGALTTLRRLRTALNLEIAALFVPPHLADLTAERHGVPINRVPPGDDEVLLVNGRCPLPPDEVINAEHGTLVMAGADLVGGRLMRSQAEAVLRGTPPESIRLQLTDPVLLTRPWHVRSVRDYALRYDLDLLSSRADRVPPPPGVQVLGDPDLAVIESEALVRPSVVIDVEDGPVTIAGGAEVRPGAVLIGPCSIGPDAVVLEQAIVRGGTVVGPFCKVAGEVAGVTFQGYANKAHAGFLGDSFVGEWVNLGAGTNGSNLLNTYTTVHASPAPGMEPESTGEMFFGAIIGDHAKFAIGSRIMTGSVLYAGSQFACSRAIAGCVPGFRWRTDQRDELYDLDRWMGVMRAVMSRRQIEPAHAYLERARALHAAAAQIESPSA